MTLRPTTCDRLDRVRSSSKNPGGRLMGFYIGLEHAESSDPPNLDRFPAREAEAKCLLPLRWFYLFENILTQIDPVAGAWKVNANVSDIFGSTIDYNRLCIGKAKFARDRLFSAIHIRADRDLLTDL